MATGWGALFGRKSGESPPGRAAFSAVGVGDNGTTGGMYRSCSFRQSFSKACDAMALFDGEVVAGTNPAWDHLFGRTEDECVGQPLSAFLPEAGREDESFPNREFPGLKSDGTRLRLEAAGHPVAWEGRPARMVSVTRWARARLS